MPRRRISDRRPHRGRVEPYAYLRDLFCLLPSWPRNAVLELAPAYLKQTLQREDVQQRLRDNPFCRISLGMPVQSPLYVAPL